MKKFSVLMSVYKNENPEFLNIALDSVINQTIKPTEIVLVKDGPLTEQLESVIENKVIENPKLFKIIQFKQNRGLGYALNEGLSKCSNLLVARMDSDDISVKNRFELQLEEFKKNPNLTIVGGYISEFAKNPNLIDSIRRVPLSRENIIKFQKKRSAFNHVTVMYNRDNIISAGSYEDVLYMEDLVLWSSVLHHGYDVKNIDKILVNVRTGSGQFERRGSLMGFKYFNRARKLLLDRKQISLWNYISINIAQIIVYLVPIRLRKFIYLHLLRK